MEIVLIVQFIVPEESKVAFLEVNHRSCGACGRLPVGRPYQK